MDINIIFSIVNTLSGRNFMQKTPGVLSYG